MTTTVMVFGVVLCSHVALAQTEPMPAFSIDRTTSSHSDEKAASEHSSKLRLDEHTMPSPGTAASNRAHATEFRSFLPESIFRLDRELCPLPETMPFWRKMIAHVAYMIKLDRSEKDFIYRLLPESLANAIRRP